VPLCPTAVAIATGGGSTGGGGGATRAVLHIVHDGRPSGLVNVHAPHTHVATGATGPGAGGPTVASVGVAARVCVGCTSSYSILKHSADSIDQVIPTTLPLTCLPLHPGTGDALA